MAGPSGPYRGAPPAWPSAGGPPGVVGLDCGRGRPGQVAARPGGGPPGGGPAGWRARWRVPGRAVDFGQIGRNTLVGRPSFAVHVSGDARAAPSGPPRPVRDRRQPVRRPRRRHQHHAPAAPGPGRRGDPSGPQPLGRRGGDRRRPGGRPGRGRQLLPGRPRRVLQVPGRPPAGRGPGRHPGLRRRGRHHRRRRDRATCRTTGWPASSRPRTARPWAWPPWSTPWWPTATARSPPPAAGRPRGRCWRATSGPWPGSSPRPRPVGLDAGHRAT